MISADKMLDIAKRLLDKTRAGNARWRPDMFHEFGYALRLQHSTIRVYGTDPADTGPVRRGMRIDNEHGSTIGELEADADSPTGRTLDALLNAAVEAGENRASVLAEIDAALSGPGVVGTR